MGPGQLASNSSRLDGHSLHFQTIRRRNHRSGRGYALSDLSGLIRIPLLKHRRVDPVCGRSRGPWLRSGRGSPPRKAPHFPPCGPLSPRAAGTGLLGSAPDRLHLPRPLGTRRSRRARSRGASSATTRADLRNTQEEVPSGGYLPRAAQRFDLLRTGGIGGEGPYHAIVPRKTPDPEVVLDLQRERDVRDGLAARRVGDRGRLAHRLPHAPLHDIAPYRCLDLRRGRAGHREGVPDEPPCVVAPEALPRRPPAPGVL